LRGFESRKKVGRREDKWVPRETRRRTEAEAESEEEEEEGQQEQQEQEIGVWVMER
jgi:hypothetical protein